MSKRVLNIGVSGLNATDNPGPGVAVIRSIRESGEFEGIITGLAYHPLDPGAYMQGICDNVFLIPYPSQGAENLLARIRAIHAKLPLDVLMPTLDSELLSFLAIEADLAAMGVRTFLPTREQLDLRSKVRLAELGRRAGIAVPESRTVTEASQLYRLHEELAYPFVVKGVFYGAKVVHTLDEALHAFHDTVARWGIPVVVQRFLAGEEYCVVAVGDGEGGLVGAVPMKKMMLTDKGKGWAGVTVVEPGLLELARRFVAATRWRGPCEVETLRTADGALHLLEVNPRFPAWTALSAGAGQNLPYAVAQLAWGGAAEPLPEPRAGTMFVRIAVDQITHIDEFAKVATTGELVRAAAAGGEEPR